MNILSQLKDKVTQYVDVYVKLIKISFIEGTANILSYFMFGMIVLFILFCIILFMGLGLVEFFIVLGLSKMLSFFLTIGAYLLLLLIVVAMRKKLTRVFSNEVVRAMTEKHEEEQDEV